MSRFASIMDNEAAYAQLTDFYAQVFPLELRCFLSTWFEGKQWLEIDERAAGMEGMLEQLVGEMLSLGQQKLQEMVSNDLRLLRRRLQLNLNDLQARYTGHGLEFLAAMKLCEQKEVELIGIIEQSSSAVGMAVVSEEDEERARKNRNNQEIMTQLHLLNQQTQDTDKKYKEMQAKQEAFILSFQENVQYKNKMDSLQKQLVQMQVQAVDEKGVAVVEQSQAKLKGYQAERTRLETQLSISGQEILKLRIELADLYQVTIRELQLVQKRILDAELIDWKRRQQIGNNGKPPEKWELDMLQSWCETLAELVWNIRSQIKRIGILRAQLPINMPEGRVDLLPDLNNIITGMLSSLVTSTFIVEQQPPQVLKKEARFAASVRLLVGAKLNIQMNAPQVKATIISENQAKILLHSDMKMKEQTSGDILNNTGSMDYQPATSEGPASLTVHFRSMQLKKIKRSDKKGSETVCEEKFCILFQSDFNVGGNDLHFQVWTLSLPVVVTVHGNQECNAMATILWDNAFAEPGRVPFVVPEFVPWPKLGEQLSLKFQQTTGRCLSPESIDYLAYKFFASWTPTDYSNKMATWVQFNKEPMRVPQDPSVETPPEVRAFTFWEWFYALQKLTKEHLRGPWVDGSIIGFISKTQAHDCLNQKENGTFLLRFSDSEQGGVTIAWIDQSKSNPNEREVWNLAPYLAKDFVVRGLADRIKDLINLTTLYPDTPKDQVFSKYYTQDPEPNPRNNGYVPTHLVQVIGQEQDRNIQDPRTPQIPPSPAPSSVAPDTPQTDDLMDDLMEFVTDGDYNPEDFMTNLTSYFDPNHAMQPQATYQPTP